VLGICHARSGQRQAALASLEELRRIAKQRYVPAYQFVIIYAELGQTDTAFQWLDKAIEEPSAILMMIKVEPSFRYAPQRSTIRGFHQAHSSALASLNCMMLFGQPRQHCWARLEGNVVVL
jgi:hypothetical protein